MLNAALLPPPPLAGGVDSYNHHDIGEEVEWRPPLMYANPLGHRIPATLKISQKYIKREPKTSARCNARCVCFSLRLDHEAESVLANVRTKAFVFLLKESPGPPFGCCVRAL